MTLFRKLKNRFKKKDKPYRPEKLSPTKKGKAMDLILGLCMNYYVGIEKDEVDFFRIEEELCSKLDMHSLDTEFLMRVMHRLEYVDYKTDDNGKVKRIFATVKGFDKFLDGGFTPEAKRQERTRKLVRIGQWSAAIAGAYYLTMLLQEIAPMIQVSWNYLTCILSNLPS